MSTKRLFRVLRIENPHPARGPIDREIIAVSRTDIVQQAADLIRETAQRFGVSTLALDWRVLERA
jgi:hypothetical protein